MTVFASAEIFEPTKGVFRAVGNMTVRRHKHGAALLADGRVLIVGGSDERDWHGKYDSAELFDPQKRIFTPVAPMHQARFKLTEAVVSLPDGKVLIAGGSEAPEIYDPATSRFSLVVGSFGVARHFASATLLRDGRVLITGGYDDHTTSTEHSWLYSGG
jgi:hypothetical protein